MLTFLLVIGSWTSSCLLLLLREVLGNKNTRNNTHLLLRAAPAVNNQSFCEPVAASSFDSKAQVFQSIAEEGVWERQLPCRAKTSSQRRVRRSGKAPDLANGNLRKFSRFQKSCAFSPARS